MLASIVRTGVVREVHVGRAAREVTIRRPQSQPPRSAPREIIEKGVEFEGLASVLS